MKTIWKFPLRFTRGGESILVRTMPADAVPLRFSMQDDIPTVWCLVDPENALIDRRFSIVGTGHEVPNGTSYIGSCDHGPFVWHMFEHLL